MGDGQLAKAYLEFAETGIQGKRRRFMVQFNPAKLTYSASGTEKGSQEEINAISDFQLKNGKIPAQTAFYKPVAAEIELSMELIFDQSLSPEKSVQKEMEGFLAAVRDPLKRKVVFCWNKIWFEGKLNVVSGEYHMFSREGKPQRAKLSVTICNAGKNSIPPRWTASTKEIFGI